ncbi:MAG: hypothetical protein KBS68_04410 [Clostridiales bacterium]|nr:hypothetical protein [Candidatus Crickella merdequi]
MAENQLFYIATSKVKEIRKGGSITYEWNVPKTFKNWKTFRSPVKASQTKVKYSKTAKDVPGARSTSRHVVPSGGETRLGTYFPHTEERMIAGVSRACEVAYYVRGYTKYVRTSSLTRQKKMAKNKYTVTKPYQYHKIYKDKPVVQKEYSIYENGLEFIFFGSEYYSDDGTAIPTEGHLPHPTGYKFGYFDVRKNFTVDSNNSDRDNSGSLVIKNVRANVATIELKWEGLTAEQAAEIIDTLNPEKDSKGEYTYLLVQYKDPQTNEIKTGTFFAGDRTITPYADGNIEEISVTLTEV